MDYVGQGYDLNNGRRIQIARDRQTVLRPLALRGDVSKNDREVAAVQLGCSERTIRRKISEYRNLPLLDTLRPGHRVSGARKSRFPPETLRILARFIAWRLRCKEKITASTIHRKTKKACELRGLPFPDIRTVQRHLKRVSFLEKARAKMVPQGVRDLKLYPHHHDVAWPLDAVQIDHTRLDLFLNLVEYGLGKKRIWLTLAIDVASRMVFGYHLGLKAPSARTSGLAVMLGCLPKRFWVERAGVSYDAFAEHGIEDPWPVQGIPQIVDSDNGSDFRSYAFKAGCLQLGTRVRYRPPGRVHYGGHIERLLGTFMSQVHALPGTTFSNHGQLRGYDPVANGFLTLEDFETWLVMAILGYHLTPHSGLGGRTPLQQYTELKQRQPLQPNLMPDDVNIQAAFLPSKRRKVGKQGVRLFKRCYSSPNLASLVGSWVIVKYHPAYIDEILVCLDGITPSFPLTCIGRAGRCRHSDALLDRLPTAAVAAETGRQKEIAEMLANQRDALVTAARRRRSPEKVERVGVSAPPKLTGRPQPIQPRKTRRW